MSSDLPKPGNDRASDDWRPLIIPVHTELIESLEWAVDGGDDAKGLADELRPLAVEVCRRRAKHLSVAAHAALVEAVMAEVIGLGPLEPLLADPYISDILVNGFQEVFIERRGRLERTEIRFADDGHVVRLIQRIAGRVGRRVDETSPTVDARLPDGSRVHAVVPPLALRGPTLSIRRFGVRPLAIDDLIAGGSLLPEMVEMLTAAIEARVSFLISGGTGAGKTTLLNALSSSIPRDERIVTIEDAAELQLQHAHVVSLETRTANTEGSGAVTTRELVRNSLRMRPDRIIVGEVRGAEAMDMLQAMNTGHEGSLTTIHANDVGDALSRLEMMVSMTGYDFPVSVVRQYIASGIRLVVHVGRLKGGLRRVLRISEIVGIEQGEYRLEEIFGFHQMGVDESGTAYGEFYATGYVPQCLRRMEAAGIKLPEELFAARRGGQSRPAVRSMHVTPAANGHAAAVGGALPQAAPAPTTLPVTPVLPAAFVMPVSPAIPASSAITAAPVITAAPAMPAAPIVTAASRMPEVLVMPAIPVSQTSQLADAMAAMPAVPILATLVAPLPAAPPIALQPAPTAAVPTPAVPTPAVPTPAVPTPAVPTQVSEDVPQKAVPPAILNIPSHVLAALAARQRQRENIAAAVENWGEEDGLGLRLERAKV